MGRAEPESLLPAAAVSGAWRDADSGARPRLINALQAGVGNAAASALLSGGHALPTEVRGQMEQSFDTDFSAVRIHADLPAAEAAAAQGAKAFTRGNDITFAAGEFAPDTDAGRELIAHELTHVVQNQSGPAATGRSRRGDSSEVEAWALARDAAAGHSVAVSAAPSAAIAASDGPPTLPEGEEYIPPTEPIPATEMPPTSVAPGGQGVPQGAIDASREYAQETNAAEAAEDAVADTLKAPPGGGGGTAAGEAAGETATQTAVEGAAEEAIPATLRSAGVEAAETAVAGGEGAGAAGAAAVEGAAAEGAGAALAEGGAIAAEGAAAGAGGAGLAGSALAVAAPLAAVAGAGYAGVEAGNYLAHNTEVGQDSVDTVGGIDKAMSTPGQGSWLLNKDDERQKDWDQGNYGSSIAAGAEEGAVGLAGAVGGLATGAAHGLSSAASSVGNWLTGDDSK